MILDANKWHEIISSLKHNKLRTFLTAFGVGWGIFMLVILLGAGNGLQNGVMHHFKSGAVNSGSMWSQQTSKAYGGFLRGRSWSITNDDILAIKTNIPQIKILAPHVHGGGFRQTNTVERDKKSGAYRIEGVYPEEFQIMPKKIYLGRLINHMDNQGTRKVMVIGKKVYEDLFEKDEDPLGQFIKFNGIMFKVIGVFRSQEEGNRAAEDNQLIFMPFSTVQRIYNYGNDVNSFTYVSKDEVSIATIEKKLIALLARRHKIHPDDERAFGKWNREDWYNKMNGLFIGIEIVLWFVGIGTLLAGIIGVSNIMLIIVKERTKEIGIQRAVGATPGNIISMILSESLFLTAIAGYFGLFVGILIVEVINKMLSKAGDGGGGMFRNPEIDLRVALVALLVLILAGALAGMIPARKAVKIKPVEAMRDDN